MNARFPRFALICVAAIIAIVGVGKGQTTKPTTLPSTLPASFTWDQAFKHVGATATVTGPVMGTHATRNKDLILNVGKDYPATDRFTVFINADPKAEITADTYQGKTVSVTGKIELDHNVPEIKASAKDVVVQK